MADRYIDIFEVSEYGDFFLSEVKVDVTKFFPGNLLGDLRQLKPADVKARAEKISEGFAVEAHNGLAALAPWSKKITEAMGSLAAGLAAKDEQKTEGILLTASASAAREEFLTAYNAVAKPLVRGLLSELGRSDEFIRYFKALQVNESHKAKPAESTPETPTTEA